MANGDITGRRSEIGYVAHTDGSATTVVQLALPVSADGYFHIQARVWGGTVGQVNRSAVIEVGLACVDGGVVALVDGTAEVGTPAYTTALYASGSDQYVAVRVTAANGYYSGAMIEAYGFELGNSPS